MPNNVMLDVQTFNTLVEPNDLPSQDWQALKLAQQAQHATPRSHFLCYVVYGDDKMYYDGVKLSILSFFAQIDGHERPTVIVLSERPDFFASWQQQTDLELINLTLSDKLFHIATQDNYYYRLKTLGLAHIMELLIKHHLADNHSKFLFFDSDTYFLTNPMPLYDKIDDKHVVMYKKESAIFTHKKYRNYLYGEANKAGINGLKGKDISHINPADGSPLIYRLQDHATMYSSLIMGVKSHAVIYLLQACNLMYPIRALTNARTVEQFCFAEIFKQHYTIIEGKEFVRHFSRRRQKAYVESQMMSFWQQFDDSDFAVQCANIHAINFQRPFWLTLAQAIKRIFKPEPIR